MKNVLVIYYSQTGQLTEILRNFLLPISADSHVDYVEIKTPCYTFPLTWTSMFDMFPESVLQVPCEISYKLPEKRSYDTIVLGFQTWFLHLSLPMFTFSYTQDFSALIKHKKVYLIMDCRNCWRPAMEAMEQRVLEIGGIIKGRYVFGSIGGNLIGSISILHWFFTGNKRLFSFPEPGVPECEIKNAAKYGKMLLNCSTCSSVVTFPYNKSKFISADIEQYVVKKFKWWAQFIVKRNNKYRIIKLLIFRIWLFCTIIIISPVVAFLRNK